MRACVRVRANEATTGGVARVWHKNNTGLCGGRRLSLRAALPNHYLLARCSTRSDGAERGAGRERCETGNKRWETEEEEGAPM